MKVLIVDDELLIRNVIKEYLKIENIFYDEAENGYQAIDLVKTNNYDCIIMDIMMPKLDGYSAIKEIKKFSNAKVIVLSARTEEYDKLSGFDLGIDDYVTKPFSPKELIARIKAVCKRNEKAIKITSIGGIKINELSRTVLIDNEEVEFTQTQFDLIALFLKNPKVAFTREMIIDNIWGYSYEADNRTIDAHIKLVRNKLGKYKNCIKTVRGVGYKFEYNE
ncbi:MAG: response regulator transcription factor [Bacilli bacterium]|nr:response regulator transcription factor [Bacilli bacterium]